MEFGVGDELFAPGTKSLGRGLELVVKFMAFAQAASVPRRDDGPGQRRRALRRHQLRALRRHRAAAPGAPRDSGEDDTVQEKEAASNGATSSSFKRRATGVGRGGTIADPIGRATAAGRR